MNNLICLRWLDLCRNKLSTEDLKIIFHLYLLQTLKLWDCCLEEIPNGIENLSDFRILDLAENELKEVPTEIGNLEQLRHLDLAGNKFSKQLPSEIGKLNLLQTLRLPIWEIHCQIPKALAQLTGLRELTGFKGGSGWSKLGLLKNLNKLGVLRLLIKLDDKDLKDMVEDAQGAELSKKMHIEQLELIFEDEMGREESLSSSRERMDIIEVLAPHSNLRILYISGYNGPNLRSTVKHFIPSNLRPFFYQLQIRKVCNKTKCTLVKPLRMARSSKFALMLSPKPAAFTAQTYRDEYQLL